MSVLNKLVVTALPVIPKSIVGRVARRYIAGESLPDAVRVVRELNGKSILATVDLLGEDVERKEDTAEVRAGILSIFGAVQENALNANVSVKPTQLGLNLDVELAYANIRAIVEDAKKRSNFVRIDMEDATTTDRTLDLYRRLREDGFSNVGVVIQAYLRRSEADIRSLLAFTPNVRLCKGIYNESPSIAFKDREEIRSNYIRLLQILLEGGAYVGVATHDDVLVDGASELVSKAGLQEGQYEYQMLLGVRESLRDRIVAEGHRLRVYVPYGKEWYAYSTRRLKENPSMAWYITKAIFIR